MAVARLEHEREELLYRLVGRDPDQTELSFGLWDCPTSPTTKCVFDHLDRPCIYCGDPAES